MEPHRTLSGIDGFSPDPAKGPQAYFDASLAFAKEFYAEEIGVIASVKFEDVSHEMFFREYVWVVHATGFSAKAVGNFMPRLAEAYGAWWNLGREDFATAFARIGKVCNNPQKSKAVHKTAALMTSEIVDTGIPWEDFKKAHLASPDLLKKLPYVGPVTCFHLARNIGILEVVKPDLHLERLAALWGFKTCVEMCEAVRPEGTPLGIVDLVLWYAASTFGTLGIRQEGAR